MPTSNVLYPQTEVAPTVDWVDRMIQSVRPKHEGPGDHPGTGTPQAVHGSGGGSQTSAFVHQTDTPEFKKWFGNSKVKIGHRPAGTSDSTIVQGDEEPLIVFHGTNSKFTVFENPYGGWNMFSTSEVYARQFAIDFGQHDKGEVKQVYLKIETPLDLSHLPAQRGDARNELIKALKYDAEGERTRLSEESIARLSEKLAYEKDLFQIINSNKSRELLKQELVAAGYDGIKFPDHFIGVDDGKRVDIDATTWVAFESNQIKSATHNSGAFDPNDPDITKHMGPGDHPGTGTPQDVHGGGDDTFKPKTPGAKIRTGFAGITESFEISLPSGARVTGYTHNQDFPNDVSSPTRGEVFYAEVPEDDRRKGIGTSLFKDALRLMQTFGTETVNLSTTSDAGRGFVKQMIKDAVISEPIRTSETGKAEYTILLKAQKHLGPGDHPSGTPQSIHGSGGGSSTSSNHHDSSGLDEIDTPAWNGSVMTVGKKLDKLQTGKLGEAIAIGWLKKNGFENAALLNVKGAGNNFPVDVTDGKDVYEVKAGLISNSRSAQQWRATIGQPGKKEQQWLKTASTKQKQQWNAGKAKAIMDRKAEVVKELSKRSGRKIKGGTITMIIDPDKKRVDLYKFSGFHHRIGWKSDQAKTAFQGTFNYE